MTTPVEVEARGIFVEAGRRLHGDAVLRYQAEVAAKVLRLLRADSKSTALDLRLLDDDKVIAAVALVVADRELP